jgi:thiol-disulfide isomerase/thioredoxin
MKMKTGLIVGIVVVLLVVGGIFFFNSSDSSSNFDREGQGSVGSSGGAGIGIGDSNSDGNDGDGNAGSSGSSDAGSDDGLRNGFSDVSNSLWYNAELVDVNTDSNFKVSDFDEPVLLESFAVWCPTCTKQQKNIKKLHEEIGDSVVSIGLDTDPNEDASKVKSHTEKNGFDWRYSISPSDVTNSLKDDFGVGFLNAPSAPVAIICPDGQAKNLDRGVKSVDELKDAVGLC